MLYPPFFICVFFYLRLFYSRLFLFVSFLFASFIIASFISLFLFASFGSDFSPDFGPDFHFCLLCFPFWHSYFIKLFDGGLQCEFIRTYFSRFVVCGWQSFCQCLAKIFWTEFKVWAFWFYKLPSKIQNFLKIWSLISRVFDFQSIWVRLNPKTHNCSTYEYSTITKAFSGPARHRTTNIIIIPKIFVRNAGQFSKLENFNYPTYLYSSHRGQLSWGLGDQGAKRKVTCKEDMRKKSMIFEKSTWFFCWNNFFCKKST